MPAPPVPLPIRELHFILHLFRIVNYLDAGSQDIRSDPVHAVQSRVFLVADPPRYVQFGPFGDLLESLDVPSLPRHDIVPARIDDGRPVPIFIRIVGSQADPGHPVSCAKSSRVFPVGAFRAFF